MEVITKIVRSLIIMALALVIFSPAAHGLAYGEGTYGSCTYDQCGISLASAGFITLNVTPGASATCTVTNDTVTVNTAASVGYSLQLSSSTAGNDMIGGTYGGSVAAVSGSLAVPASLTANSWGYRVDGSGGFGAGPTSALSDGGIPSLDFAAVPTVSSPDTIKTTAEAAVNDTTDVWYGICADPTLTADTYRREVTYTAVVN